MTSNYNSTSGLPWRKRGSIRTQSRPSFNDRHSYRNKIGSRYSYKNNGVALNLNRSKSRKREGVDYLARAKELLAQSLDNDTIQTLKKAGSRSPSGMRNSSKDREASKHLVNKLMKENHYLKNKFSKLRKNCSSLEEMSDNLHIRNYGDAEDLAPSNTNLIINQNLRKENRKLNDLLKETVKKNDMLLKRVGAVEREQKMDIRRMKNDLTARIREENQSFSDKKVFELKDKNAKLESENSILRLDVDKLKEQLEDMEKESFDLKKRHQQELRESKAEIELRWLRKHEQKLKQGINQGSEMSYEFRRQMDLMSSKNDHLRKQLDERQKKIRAITEKFTGAENRALEKSLEAEKLRSRLDDIKRNTEKVLRENTMLGDKIRLLNDKVKITNDRCKNLTDSLVELRAENARIKREKEIEERKSKIGNVEKVHAESLNEQLLDEVRKLERKTDAQDNQIEDLEGALEETNDQLKQSEKKSGEMKALLSEYEDRNKVLEEWREKLTIAIEGHIESYKNLQGREKDLMIDLNDARAKVELSLNHNAAKDTQTQGFIHQLETVKYHLEKDKFNKEQEIMNLQQEIDGLRLKNEDLVELVDKERGDKVMLNQENIKLRADINNLSSSLNMTENDRKGLEMKVSQVQSQKNMSEKKLRDWEMEMNNLRYQLEEAKNDEGEAAEKVLSAQSRLNQLMNELTGLRNEYRQIDQQNQELIMNLNQCQNNLEAANNTNFNQQNLINNYQAQIKELEFILQDVQNKNNSLVNKIIVLEGMVNAAEISKHNLHNNLEITKDIANRASVEAQQMNFEKNIVIDQCNRDTQRLSCHLNQLINEKETLKMELTKKPKLIKEVIHAPIATMVSSPRHAMPRVSSNALASPQPMIPRTTIQTVQTVQSPIHVIQSPMHTINPAPAIGVMANSPPSTSHPIKKATIVINSRQPQPMGIPSREGSLVQRRGQPIHHQSPLRITGDNRSSSISVGRASGPLRLNSSSVKKKNRPKRTQLRLNSSSKKINPNV